MWHVVAQVVICIFGLFCLLTLDGPNGSRRR